MKKWWLIGAGVVGIGLAVVLFPRPDTGADPAVAEDPQFAGRAERLNNGVVRPGVDPATVRGRTPVDQRNGPTPMAAENAKRRAMPEAVYAGRATAPLAMIRRELFLMEDP